MKHATSTPCALGDTKLVACHSNRPPVFDKAVFSTRCKALLFVSRGAEIDVFHQVPRSRDMHACVTAGAVLPKTPGTINTRLENSSE